MPLRAAHGRILAADAVARRDQPPFASSAMDGYGVLDGDVALGACFEVIGEVCGRARVCGRNCPRPSHPYFHRRPRARGHCPRDHPGGCDPRRRYHHHLGPPCLPTPNIRPLGGDFRRGDRLTAPRRLTPQDVALLAAMNINEVTVTRRPVVALIATGDELVMPGETPGPSQIIASNSYGLAAMIDAAGGRRTNVAPSRQTMRPLCAPPLISPLASI